MNWGQFFIQIVLELGGLTGIAILCLKHLGNTFTDALSKKYELKIEKQLALFSSNIENKSYVDKKKFDTEFNVCCQMSQDVIKCFEAIETITPKDGDGIEQAMEIPEIKKVINDFSLFVNKNMPMLSEELFMSLSDLIGDFNKQISAYENVISDTENNEVDFISSSEFELKKTNICHLLQEYYKILGISLSK